MWLHTKVSTPRLRTADGHGITHPVSNRFVTGAPPQRLSVPILPRHYVRLASRSVMARKKAVSPLSQLSSILDGNTEGRGTNVCSWRVRTPVSGSQDQKSSRHAHIHKCAILRVTRRLLRGKQAQAAPHAGKDQRTAGDREGGSGGEYETGFMRIRSRANRMARLCQRRNGRRHKGGKTPCGNLLRQRVDAPRSQDLRYNSHWCSVPPSHRPEHQGGKTSHQQHMQVNVKRSDPSVRATEAPLS